MVQLCSEWYFLRSYSASSSMVLWMECHSEYYWRRCWRASYKYNSIDNTTEVWFIVEWYVQIPSRVPLKQYFIFEWSNGIEWYSQIPLRIPLKSDLLLKSMFQYHWEYHWNLIYHRMVQWYWVMFSNTIENTTENNILPLDGPLVLNGITHYHSEYHWVL